MEFPGYRPLYRQVYDIMVEKVAQGVWRAGEALPSEQALARELGVSQGTMRKVLDAMTAENLLERHQGKGTFVASNTQERSLFRFFRMVTPDGERVTPARGEESVVVRAARAMEQKRLDLPKKQRVIEITRTRLLEGRPAILETIILSASLFQGIETRRPLPNTLYSLYQTDFGINIISTEEQLRPDIANKEDHKMLGAPLGAPIQCIDRIAKTLQDRKVEWRLSRIYAPNLAYAVTLS
jgi:GntR family transcriptional regulator